ILVPLCFGGQKQFHYLFPAMPALAVLNGWVIDQMLERRDLPLGETELARNLFVATVVVMLAAALALPLISWKMRGGVRPIDWLIMTICALGAAMSMALLRRGLRRGMFAFAVASAIGMAVIMQAWAPSLR